MVESHAILHRVFCRSIFPQPGSQFHKFHGGQLLHRRWFSFQWVVHKPATAKTCIHHTMLLTQHLIWVGQSSRPLTIFTKTFYFGIVALFHPVPSILLCIAQKLHSIILYRKTHRKSRPFPKDFPWLTTFSYVLQGNVTFYALDFSSLQQLPCPAERYTQVARPHFPTLPWSEQLHGCAAVPVP